MVQSKRKGSKFEREVAKWLTEWSGFKFQRTPYSGANHLSRDLASDIMCADERHAHRCKISVECKSYKEIKFEHVLLGTKGSEIEKFWKQAKRDADRSKKVPILIMRYNSMPKNEFFIVVEAHPVGMSDAFLTQDIVNNERFIAISTPEHYLYVFMASAVKKLVNYKDVHRMAKQILKSN